MLSSYMTFKLALGELAGSKRILKQSLYLGTMYVHGTPYTNLEHPRPRNHEHRCVKLK